jgi:hypothetical protein
MSHYVGNCLVRFEEFGGMFLTIDCTMVEVEEHCQSTLQLCGSLRLLASLKTDDDNLYYLPFPSIYSVTALVSHSPHLRCISHCAIYFSLSSGLLPKKKKV